MMSKMITYTHDDVIFVKLSVPDMEVLHKLMSPLAQMQNLARHIIKPQASYLVASIEWTHSENHTEKQSHTEHGNKTI